MLLSGCCAVNDTPATCVWNRNFVERGLDGEYRSTIKSCHSRRAARNFETSSRKSLWQLKKKDRRGANVSTSNPFWQAESTYANAFEIVNANS